MPSVNGTATRFPTSPLRAVRHWLGAALGLRSGAGPRPFDALEGRRLLSPVPPPAIGDLEDPGNPVVRIETNYGVIDIELFIGAAPVTVANYLNYVTSQRFDHSFFHRSVTTPNLFVLQGGGFTFSDVDGLGAITTDAPIIRETTGRSNLARTVAMARTNDIDSATSQFFINYVDNTFLDPTNPGNGYAVFGRVVQGWDNVLAIQALAVQDLTADQNVSGSPQAGVMGEVPVGPTYNSGNGLREQDLVTIINAEVFKPAGNVGFFTHTVYMPEGFRSDRSVETLSLHNPNSGTANYQVIARYENGQRDQVVTAGSINSNTSLEIRISDFNDTGLDLVRQGTPYALIVESALSTSVTDPQPVSATFNRQDFNAATGETFFNVAGYTDSDLQTWDIARIERDTLSQEFLVWVNLSPEPATVTVTFYTDQGLIDIVRSLDAYRRGGLEVHGLGLPSGILSARVSSTQPIVAALSDWDLPNSTTALPGDAGFYTPGFMSLGVPGSGSTHGGLADLSAETGWTNVISIFSPNGPAVVTFSFWRDSRPQGDAPIQRSVVVTGAGARRSDFIIDTDLLGIPVGEKFAATYSSGSTLVSLSFTSVDETNRHESTSSRADGVSTSFVSQLGPSVSFGDGRWDPARAASTQAETVSIFNPFASATAVFTYTLRYTFSDGTTIDAQTGSLDPNGRVTIRTGDLAGVMAKVQSGAQFQRYAISVVGNITDTPNSINQAHAGLVTFTRYDSTLGRSVTSSGMPSALGLSMSDPILLPA